MKRLPTAILLGLAGCAGQPDNGGDPSGGASLHMTESERQAEIERRTAGRRGTDGRLPERAPEPAENGVIGEVPASLLVEMRKDLADRLDAGNANISVVVAESVTWNDGSLGCPQPGRLYTQAIVPGYRVVLELAGQRYTYHADAGGYFVPCNTEFMLRPGREVPVK